MENNDRAKIVLAALLHDIGKFYQRADDSGARRSTMLDKSIKELEEMYCPLINNSFRGYKHVIWTAQFLTDHEAFFKTLIGEDYNRFFKAAVAHHRPDSNDIWQVIIQKADHYSSGADRTQEKGISDAISENKWDEFKNVRMRSIFEGILKEEVTYQYQLPIQTLQTKADYFPKKMFTSIGQADYAVLWNKFVKAFETLKDTRPNLDAFIESFVSILGKYTVNIPSSTEHLPDVSLFDHLKSTAGMADCLYVFLVERNELSQFDLSTEDAPIRMIGGDLSGIQKYIYDIISKGAAKNLKGRSFYLYLLVDNIVRYLLRALDLSSVNIIYMSGGGFYMLAPNTLTIKIQLEKATKELEDKLFNVHREKLYLGIASIPITQGMIMQQEINQAWKQLMDKIGKTKRQKFKRVLLSNYDNFFEPIEVGGKQRKDAITNEELSEIENEAANKNQYGQLIKSIEGAPVKLSTYNQIELGKKLREVKWWIVSHQKITHWKHPPFEICDLGIYNYLFTEDDLKNAQGRLSVDNAYVNTFEIENLSLAPNYFNGTNNSYHFNFYGGNDFPKDEKGEPLTFDKLAETANGTQKLGILRMDIDNLGSIFARGLGQKDRTFSKYSALSRSLDYFFKGYLNTIWQATNFKSSTFIIYAGGDDLFIVGAWDSLIEMANTIQQQFKKWTCYNPHLSISGGIVIVSGKFPITKGAEMAEVAEKTAKRHECFSIEKNAFTLLGKALNWEKELPLVTNIFKELVNHTRANTLPRGILHKLIQYAQIARYQEENNLNPKWRWHIVYDFSQAARRTKDKSAKAFYDKIKMAAYSNTWNNESINPKYSFLDLLEVAARWAELATKN